MPVCRGVCHGFKVQSQIAGKCAVTPGAAWSGALSCLLLGLGPGVMKQGFRLVCHGVWWF